MKLQLLLISCLNQASIISPYLFLRKWKLGALDEIPSEKATWDKEVDTIKDDPQRKLHKANFQSQSESPKSISQSPECVFICQYTHHICQNIITLVNLNFSK